LQISKFGCGGWI